MRCYLIQGDQVTARPTAPGTPPEGSSLITKSAELDARRFPNPRLIRIWNALPGIRPVRRFTDRKAAVRRIWTQLAKLPLSSPWSKQDQIISMLRQVDGCTMADLTSASGWQPHSVRGLISGTLRKKLGLTVESARSGNCRVYRIPA